MKDIAIGNLYETTDGRRPKRTLEVVSLPEAAFEDAGKQFDRVKLKDIQTGRARFVLTARLNLHGGYRKIEPAPCPAQASVLADDGCPNYPDSLDIDV